jgi:L-ribulokinase
LLKTTIFLTRIDKPFLVGLLCRRQANDYSILVLVEWSLLMAVVAGVDFGTLSVRVSLVDSERGLLESAVAEYPLHRKREDPEYATQSHEDHLRALVAATREVLKKANLPGERVDAIALDTTGSSVIPVGQNLEPLGEYYLWCDHRAKDEAAEITDVAHREGLEAINWCGGVYSSEWGFSKLLHWLRHNPEKRPRFVSAFEHCDMIAATLCGITDAKKVKRSVCAMGHKWMWNAKLGGLPSEQFLVKVDPLLAGVREKLEGEYATSDRIAGRLSPEWAAKLGLKAGIPIPVGAFDAHWDAIGAGCRTDDIVNVIGTSTCIIGITPSANLVPGVCGVVQGSVHPQRTGIEAGLSAVGDIFSAIATRAGTDVKTLSQGLDKYRAGQTGLLRLAWDNGDRTVLVNPNLRGVTFGWNLQTTAQDELFAAIEGTALHTRVILDRMAEHGVHIRRIINAGGIPQKNDVLNRVYANVLGRPVLVPSKSVTSLGSAIFAFLAAGIFKTVEEAQDKICPPNKVFEPDKSEQRVYAELHGLYSKLYFALGQPGGAFGEVLPKLIQLAANASEKHDA